MLLTIHLAREEEKLVSHYARFHSISMGEAFKKALFEKIEEEYDLTVAKEAYQDYLASGSESTAIEDFWRELQ